MAKIEEQRAEAVAKLRKEGCDEPRNLEEQALCLVGKDIYVKLIKGYTEKQWGRDCASLPAFIVKRLPVRLVFDNNYFNDAFQGIPIGGYNKLIDGLLDGIDYETNIDFFKEFGHWNNTADKLLFTGRIDEYFGHRYGKLDYRTVRFETEVLDMPNFQGNAVVNYTDRDVPYTRVIEHKHFEMFGDNVEACPKTVISREYSAEWHDGMEPFYPVNDEKNALLYQRYKELAEYYDMAPIVEKVMNMQIL